MTTALGRLPVVGVPDQPGEPDASGSGAPAGQPPCLRLGDGRVVALARPVTTVGRGPDVDVRLRHPSVSRLHAEFVRRGRLLYVSDLGLSANGTFVNGEPVTQRLLGDGDVVSCGAERLRVVGTGLPGAGRLDDAVTVAPALSARELDVLTLLCLPALDADAFPTPPSAVEIADALVVTEAAVKQHLLRLYRKFGVGVGPDRRTRLANAAVATGVVHRRMCRYAFGNGRSG